MKPVTLRPHVHLTQGLLQELIQGHVLCLIIHDVPPDQEDKYPPSRYWGPIAIPQSHTVPFNDSMVVAFQFHTQKDKARVHDHCCNAIPWLKVHEFWLQCYTVEAFLKV